jgi:hypothetical protein
VLTANIYPGEGRVDGKCEVNVIWAFRILRWEFVSKRDGLCVFHYVKSAHRYTRSGRQSVLERLSNLTFPPGSRAVFAVLGPLFAIHGTIEFHYIHCSWHTLSRKFLSHSNCFTKALSRSSIVSWFASCISRIPRR